MDLDMLRNLSTHWILFVIPLAYLLQIVLLRKGVFLSRHLRLRSKGLDLLLEGKPVEAEKCYRTALGLGSSVPESDRVRLLVCLGDALLDQGRYEEAKNYLMQALTIGDPTSSGRGSMCDVLLAQKAEPEKALEMADEALRYHGGSSSLFFGRPWYSVTNELYEVRTWARKAQALMMLDRQTEAQQAMDRALRILDSVKSDLEHAAPTVTSFRARLVLGNRLIRQKQLAISGTYWRVGQSLLALGESQKAAQHFQVVCHTDQIGKYRKLAREQLNKIGDTL